MTEKLTARHKTVIIINGSGGCGKDAVCKIAAKYYKTENQSAIDGIKTAAKLLGWTGSKDLKDRKFLSDLQDLSTAYNNFSIRNIFTKYQNFMKSDNELMFVHIRKPVDIASFLEKITASGGKAATLLISRTGVNPGGFGNNADDGVQNYKYDYVYVNDTKSLADLETDILPYLRNIIFEFAMKS